MLEDEMAERDTPDAADDGALARAEAAADLLRVHVRVELEDVRFLPQAQRDARRLPGVEAERGRPVAGDQLVDQLAVAGHVLLAGHRRVDNQPPFRP